MGDTGCHGLLFPQRHLVTRFGDTTTAISSGARSGLAANFSAAEPSSPAASARARPSLARESPRRAITRHGRSEA